MVSLFSTYPSIELTCNVPGWDTDAEDELAGEMDRAIREFQAAFAEREQKVKDMGGDDNGMSLLVAR